MVHLRGHETPNITDLPGPCGLLAWITQTVCEGGPHILGHSGHLRWQVLSTGPVSFLLLSCTSLFVLPSGWENQKAKPAGDLAQLLGPGTCSLLSLPFISPTNCPSTWTPTAYLPWRGDRGQDFRPIEPNPCLLRSCKRKTPGRVYNLVS